MKCHKGTSLGTGLGRQEEESIEKPPSDVIVPVKLIGAVSNSSPERVTPTAATSTSPSGELSPGSGEWNEVSYPKKVSKSAGKSAPASSPKGDDGRDGRKGGKDENKDSRKVGLDNPKGVAPKLSFAKSGGSSSSAAHSHDGPKEYEENKNPRFANALQSYKDKNMKLEDLKVELENLPRPKLVKFMFEKLVKESDIDWILEVAGMLFQKSILKEDSFLAGCFEFVKPVKVEENFGCEVFVTYNVQYKIVEEEAVKMPKCLGTLLGKLHKRTFLKAAFMDDFNDYVQKAQEMTNGEVNFASFAKVVENFNLEKNDARSSSSSNSGEDNTKPSVSKKIDQIMTTSSARFAPGGEGKGASTLGGQGGGE